MLRHTIIAIKFTIVTTILLGLVYPLVITGMAQAIFPRQANGSLIEQGGRIVGSELIGQQFTKPEYFHPRPSVAGDGYDASASAASNLGPTSKVLAERVASDVDRAVRENPGLRKGRVPADMITTSASGLDPDISPANAYAQAARIAKARGMTVESVKRIIKANTAERQLGVLGEPRVNVLKLNLALDAHIPYPSARKTSTEGY